MMRILARLRWQATVAALLCLPAVAAAQAGPGVCGALDNHYGPFDYRSSAAAERNIVERRHFTPEVENLIKGSTSMGPGGDLSYTLKVFPNHHRALMAMMKLALREQRGTPRESAYSMACWFERGERFAADDAMVRVIHGLYLIRSGRKADAVAQLEKAVALESSDANVHYNLGLAWFELGRHEEALRSAQVAYAAGFPLPGLREKLRRAGRWQEPPAGR